MPTVFQTGPYRFFFYSSDRDEPPHIHVEREDKIAKFWLDPSRLQLRLDRALPSQVFLTSYRSISRHGVSGISISQDGCSLSLAMLPMYRTLKSERIIATADHLRARIQERFPQANLGKVCDELCAIAQEARSVCLSFGKPNVLLRTGIVVLLTLGLAGLILSLSQVRFSQGVWLVENFLEALEALLGIIVCIGASILFLVTLETRLRRRLAHGAINELRAIAHIIDMHQLTKDPEPILARGPATPHSPKRTLSPFELSRYFDYCSEMLSLVSKIAALYAQEFPDVVILRAVDDIEDLTTGLSRKIWQKIMILERFTEKHQYQQVFAMAHAEPVHGVPDER